MSQASSDRTSAGFSRKAPQEWKETTPGAGGDTRRKKPRIPDVEHQTIDGCVVLPSVCRIGVRVRIRVCAILTLG